MENQQQPLKKDPEEYIKFLEEIGSIDPKCSGCIEAYEALREGKSIPFGPPHQNSSYCDSGRRPHCSCDSCF